MAFTRPTEFPAWATSDQVNPTSGQNNVVTPDAAHKTFGWDFKEKPPRQYFNWLGRLQYEWSLWFDQEVNRIGSGFTTTTPTVDSGPTGSEVSSGTPRRFTIKRFAAGSVYTSGMGFGMVAFRMNALMSGDEAYLTIEIPEPETNGSYVPKGSIDVGSTGDAPIAVPIAARISAGGIGTALDAFAVAAKDASDSGTPKIFLGSAELMKSLIPTVNFWLNGNTYEISGSFIYPLDV
jgi:hypothetical protein